MVIGVSSPRRRWTCGQASDIGFGSETEFSLPASWATLMQYCLQYHNYKERGLPLGRDPAEWFGDGRRSIFTGLKFVQEEVGSQVFLIAGFAGKPHAYYLWSTFVIDDVEFEPESGKYVARGEGWMLNPPQLLEGPDFDIFRGKCANFAAFKDIGDLQYTNTLRLLADEFHRQEWDEMTLSFCESLFEKLPADEEAELLANHIRWWIEEGQAAADELEHSEAARTLAFIKARRGQPQFRQSLIDAYGGRCAITDCDAIEALEAAHIVPFDGDETNVLRNGLLLRADIHTLFDLGLVKIDPETRRVVLSKSLRSGSYKSLHGAQLREPKRTRQRPSDEALLDHWSRDELEL